jgi:DNA repair protein RadC
MTIQIYHSPALVTFYQCQHIQDVQILIEDRELYNHLPGKFERPGIKTLSNWPFFVTAILRLETQQKALSLKEGSEESLQLPIFDLSSTVNPTGTKSRKRKVQRTLAEIRRLYDELNAELYAKPTERPVIHTPADAFSILQAFLGLLDHEELWVMGLDTRNRVMSLTKLYQGSVNASQVRVAEVFRQAITDNAPTSSWLITIPVVTRLPVRKTWPLPELWCRQVSCSTSTSWTISWFVPLAMSR